jgi:formylglycine-generating enzyme required for sulfatase activity
MQMNRINFVLPEEPELTDAEWQIERFVQKFQPQYRFEWPCRTRNDWEPEYFLLAQYAALPVVLTPELLNYLRGRFLPQVPWIAEADLLLSELCRSVGPEQYVLLPAVRSVLMAELEKNHPEVLPVVARKIIDYSRYWARTNLYITHREQRKQEWSAMGYIVEELQALADQIAEAFAQLDNSLSISALNWLARQEMEHLARLVQEMSPRLGDYPRLLAYAELVTRVSKEPELVSLEELSQSYMHGDLVLPKLEKLIFGKPEPSPSDFSELQSFEFDVAEFVELTTLPLERVPHHFEVATIEIIEPQRAKSKPQIVINRQAMENWQYLQLLESKSTLELVKIPAGRFTMGSPKKEPESEDSERPQHHVTVPEFYMGKYLVTQAQWRFGAGLPKIDRDLEPDPSRFKGDDLPVERVSWLEAIEFCARLSIHTGREYRLPSEAEWEYACRAGTTTPFHFGETIDPQVANYNGGIAYGKGQEGLNRQETTAVGVMKVANLYGLYDMHGNVWEWCQDHWHSWHSSYQGAPRDGSAWINQSRDGSARRNQSVLRGGSWLDIPRYCRSAVRSNELAKNRYFSIGFRVVCPASPL